MRKLFLLGLVLLVACSQTADPTPPAGQLEITSFTASPNPFRVGDAVTLEWTITGETPTKLELARIDIPIETREVSGTQVTVFPSEDETYSLTAESPNGFDLKSLELVMTE